MQKKDIPALRTVAHVDLERYAGRWFEIARYPSRFERQCAKNTTAEYTLKKNGTVLVENRCSTENGPSSGIIGTARVVDEQTNAKLTVKFAWYIPRGDYWIIDLDPGYRYAVVGEPNRQFLWILARTPALDETVLAHIYNDLRGQGYDPDTLVPTAQDGYQAFPAETGKSTS